MNRSDAEIIADYVDETRIVKIQLAAAIADKDCWVFNTKTLQTGFNSLDA